MSDRRWRGFLYSPLWYVIAVSGLAGLTVYFHLWWGLTGGVALVWGLWLVWQSFKQGEARSDDEEQLQTWLNRARYYQAQINQALKLSSSKSALYEQSLAEQVNTWVEVIEDLAQRLAVLRQDDLIRRELAAAPQAIASLETQLAGATDEVLRAHLEQALTHRRTQLAWLKGLQDTMSQTEIQIENTLALLSTIYSQILTGQSVKQVVAGGRMLTGLDEEVHRLQDRLEALREVKGYSPTEKFCRDLGIRG